MGGTVLNANDRPLWSMRNDKCWSKEYKNRK